MTNQAISPDDLARVTGGQAINLPWSGAVHQNIITNAPMATQNITVVQPPPAAKPVTSIVEYMRTNPAARLQAMQNRPVVHGGW